MRFSELMRLLFGFFAYCLKCSVSAPFRGHFEVTSEVAFEVTEARIAAEPLSCSCCEAKSEGFERGSVREIGLWILWWKPCCSAPSEVTLRSLSRSLLRSLLRHFRGHFSITFEFDSEITLGSVLRSLLRTLLDHF